MLCCGWVIFAHGFVGHPVASAFSGLSAMGVHVFFSLSGFLITRLLLLESRATGRFDLRSFYWRRALRILPVYFSALGAAMIGLFVIGEPFARLFGVKLAALDLWRLAITHFFFVANWVEQTLPTCLDVLWSISVEEQFYILFPLALLLTRTRRGVLTVILIGIALSWAVRGWLSVTAPVEIYRNTFATGDHLLLGALLAFCTEDARLPRVFERLGTTGQVLVLAAVIAISTLNPSSASAFFLRGLASALCSTLMVGFIGLGTGALSRFFSLRPIRYLGQLTYAAYVFHMYGIAVAWFVVARFTANVSIAAPVRTLLALPIVFGVAYASRKFLEEPAQRLRRVRLLTPLPGPAK